MKKIYIKELGTLRIERVLVRIDYPVLFLCVNEKGKMFLFLEMESGPTGEKWVVVKTDDAVLNKLSRREIPIQKAFINLDIERYYVINHSYEHDLYTCRIEKNMPTGVLNEGEDYLTVPDNTNAILESAKTVTSRNESPVLDIHLNPYSHKHSIGASFLNFVIGKIISMYNCSTRKNRNDLMVEFEPGSFVIRFYSKSIDSLIPNESSLEAFKTIGNLLSANNIDEISNEIVSVPKLLSPAKDLINKFSREKEDFDVIVTNNDDSSQFFKRINIDNLAKLNTDLKEYTVKEEEKNETGILKSYDSVRKTFKFKLDSTNEILNGKWDKSFIDKKYTVHERYKASFVEVVETFKNESKSSFKKSYRLLKIEV